MLKKTTTLLRREPQSFLSGVLVLRLSPSLGRGSPTIPTKSSFLLLVGTMFIVPLIWPWLHRIRAANPHHSRSHPNHNRNNHR